MCWDYGKVINVRSMVKVVFAFQSEGLDWGRQGVVIPRPSEGARQSYARLTRKY